MGKTLSLDSIITDRKKETGKFEVTLDKEIFNQLVRYIVLTQEGKGRNQFIQSLIEEKIGNLLLTDDYINLNEKDCFYFNVNDLLNNKEVTAEKNKLPAQDLNEVFVVCKIPNNLDVFEPDLKTYCYNGRKHQHRGVYILPKYKQYDRKIIVFDYDSEKESLKISWSSENDFKELFRHKRKKRVLLDIHAEADSNNLERGLLSPIQTNYVMYRYTLNEDLKDRKKKADAGEVEHLNIMDEIYFNGIFF